MIQWSRTWTDKIVKVSEWKTVVRILCLVHRENSHMIALTLVIFSWSNHQALVCRAVTCDVLRLHGACFHQKGLPALERRDGLADQSALGLCRVPAALQLDELLKVGCLAVGRDAVLVGWRLNAVYYRTRPGRVEVRCPGGLFTSCTNMTGNKSWYICGTYICIMYLTDFYWICTCTEVKVHIQYSSSCVYMFVTF